MKMTKIFTLMTGLVLMSACGSQVAREASLTSGAAVSNPGDAVGVQTGNIYNLPLAQENIAHLSGANGTSPTYSTSVDTSSTLRVKVTPLSAPNLTLSGYTNWVFPYGCLQLQVHANGTTQMTQILRVDGVTQGANSPCKNAPTSQILDFTNAVTGYTNVIVTVTNPVYDNCRYSWPMNYGCSMSAVFATHLVAASIAVQNDGHWLNP